MDSQLLTVEWIAKKTDRLGGERGGSSPTTPIDPQEMAALHKRAQEFLKSGDIASARLLLRRAASAASAGSADAALALGATFDDEFLAGLGVLGFKRDPEQARAWYQKAAQLGSEEAARRLKKIEGAAR
jgi:TPR repeat protein